MRVERDIRLRHEDRGDLLGVVMRKALVFVHLRELDLLAARVVGDLTLFDVHLVVDELFLCSDRHELTRRHRECAGKEPGQTGQTDGCRGGMSAGDAQHQRDVRDQAVARAEDGGPCAVCRDVTVSSVAVLTGALDHVHLDRVRPSAAARHHAVACDVSAIAARSRWEDVGNAPR